MNKVMISGVIIASFITYAFINDRSMDVDSKSTTASLPSATTSENVSQTITTTIPPSSSQYKDGEYIGKTADAFYGNIQVKAIIQGGQLTDVQFLQYPNDHSESIEINTAAMPMLKQEAITAQSANVEIVSRATDSSNAFIESLTSALEQAKS